MNSLTTGKAALVARDMTRGLSMSLTIFMVIVGAGFLLVGLFIVALGGFDGPLADSVWENSAYATRYYPLAIGVMLTGFYFEVGVANGVTRRTFALGAAATVLAVAAAMALLEAAGYAIEHGMYSLGGLTQQFTTPHLFDAGTEVWIVVPEVWITVSANVAVGWLIGTAYYKWGALGPTLALPLLVVPALVVEALMAVGWAGAVMENVVDARAPLVLAIPGSVAVIALTLWGTHLLVRTIVVRPST